jgi:LysR family transcriptional regulator, glycine cleavage system transcriptional activator
MDAQRRSRLPSLAALRAFEAVARNLSFTKAAAELRLTQGAISYQIKELEEEIGVALFLRNGRNIKLSSEAALFLPTLQRALADISHGIVSMRLRSGEEPVLIALSTYFAAHWLLRRLARFWRHHPGIKLRLHHPENVAAPDIHLTIRWHKAGWKDDRGVTELLFLSDLTPVCSPSLGLTKAKDLVRHTLLLDEITGQAWVAWLKRANLREQEGLHEMNIGDPNVYIQAAIDGQGVALGDELLDDEVALGRLVRPFNVKLQGYGYFVSCTEEALKFANVVAFREWLLAEARTPFE